MADDPMWCLVMFDLPTQTATQRRAYATFRNFLLDQGFVRVQYSIYTKYSTSGVLSARAVNLIKRAVPCTGEIRLLHITDRQWADMVCYFNSQQIPDPVEKPEQLLIF